MRCAGTASPIREALTLQEQIVSRKMISRGRRRIAPAGAEPVYTIGRTPDRIQSPRRLESASPPNPNQPRRPGHLPWPGTAHRLPHPRSPLTRPGFAPLSALPRGDLIRASRGTRLEVSRREGLTGHGWMRRRSRQSASASAAGSACTASRSMSPAISRHSHESRRAHAGVEMTSIAHEGRAARYCSRGATCRGRVWRSDRRVEVSWIGRRARKQKISRDGAGALVEETRKYRAVTGDFDESHSHSRAMV